MIENGVSPEEGISESTHKSSFPMVADKHRIALKFIAIWVGRLIVTVSLLLILKQIFSSVGQIPNSFFTIHSVVWSVSAVAFGTLANGLAAFAWLLLLPSDSMPVRVGIRIWFVSNIGKYLPGNIFHYVGRFTLLRVTTAIKSRLILQSMTLESVYICLAAALVLLWGSIATDIPLSTWTDDFISISLPMVYLGAIALFASLFAGLLIVGKVQLSSVVRLAVPMTRSILIYCVLFGIFGASMWLLLKGMFSVDNTPDLPFLMTAYAVAFVVGYIVPGAPGGIGVRELILTALLTPVTGASIAIWTAVVLRASSMCADLVCYLIGKTLLSR